MLLDDDNNGFDCTETPGLKLFEFKVLNKLDRRLDTIGQQEG